MGAVVGYPRLVVWREMDGLADFVEAAGARSGISCSTFMVPVKWWRFRVSMNFGMFTEPEPRGRSVPREPGLGGPVAVFGVDRDYVRGEKVEGFDGVAGAVEDHVGGVEIDFQIVAGGVFNEVK